MNEQLEKALIQIIDKAVSGIDAASEFLVAETPQVIQQLLLWYGVYNFLMMLISIVAIWAAYKITVKAYKMIILSDDVKLKLSDDEDYNVFLFHVACFILFFITAITVLRLMNLEWLQIWIAPKVWLLEYAGSLVK